MGKIQVVKIILPPTDLSMVEWFIKHNVSAQTASLDEAIARALDSQIVL